MNARRILIVDDNKAIHEDIRKIFAVHGEDDALSALEADLFGQAQEKVAQETFDIDSAYQGQEALQLVERACAEGRPYGMAFVDVRMPPGWDGIETVEHLWKVDPDLQVVICTAYSDHSWTDIVTRLGQSDGLLVLKKPFDAIEVSQMAHALTAKWQLRREVRRHVDELEAQVRARTAELETAHAELKHEIADRQRMEVELRLAQKLEAVGQLAAGVAHEINTPVQFVGDSVHFLKTSFEDLRALIDVYREVIAEAATPPLAARARDAEESADLEYLLVEIPSAFERVLDGTARVSGIVGAMKEFAHDDRREMSAGDLNKAIQNTLTVARNEYKYVAELETDYAELPPVTCHLGDLNQVFLNLIVNAAHAIADVVGSSGTMGHIRVRTTLDGDHVLIAIADSGTGIPEEVRGRVFDPFFTTKEVGRGSGQGLAIARSIVVEKHRGAIWFDTALGRGTTFFVRLPIDGRGARGAEVAA